MDNRRCNLRFCTIESTKFDLVGNTAKQLILLR